MNDVLSIFITWQFLVLCIGITAITAVIRTVVEYTILNNPKMPGNSNSKFWRDFFLVLLPIGLGVGFTWVGKTFPYPSVIVEPYSRFLFTSSAGLLSPTLYRVIKAMFWKTAGNDFSQQPVVFPPANNQPVSDQSNTDTDNV